MPITASYEVQCDVCFGVMDGRYETREDAEDAKAELGWNDPNSGTACPEHRTHRPA
ncbi:hypothetical protein ACIQVR_41080 [Streptomyces xanthochromogenes]|uniref:hypothetical protein n=1 Tax=Streptomyces xanthochromogenes TaxID=67384 RepID=UPI003820418E